MPPPEFTRWLEGRVKGRAPAAAVRFGDSEARLLTLDPDDSEAMQGGVRTLEVEAGPPASPAEVLEVKALLAHAYEQADVLGINTDEQALPERKRWMAKLAHLHAERMEAGGHPAALAHCMLGHHVANALPRLLAGRRVSVISCRDLGPILEADWGLEGVAVYQVPSQYRVRDVDGAYEATLHHMPIWPDAHDRIEAELTVRQRGEVFLVGAGLFGKDLCIRVRELGGIALDMGSALDRVAGKLTRGPRRRVVELHAAGAPLAHIPSRLRAFYGVSGRDEEIRRVIEEALETAHANLAAWRARPLPRAHQTICFDTVEVEIGEGEDARRPTLHLALGVTEEDLDPLGIWWEDASRPEPPRAAIEDLRRRGAGEAAVVNEPVSACDLVRKAILAHGPFPDEHAAETLAYLALWRAIAQLGTLRS